MLLVRSSWRVAVLLLLGLALLASGAVAAIRRLTEHGVDPQIVLRAHHVAFACFGAVALIAIPVTLALRRAAWRAWTNELRRIVFLSFGPGRDGSRAAAPFRPL